VEAEELARRLDQGESLQLLDIRSSQFVARGRVTLGTRLAFHAIPGSALRAPQPGALAELDPKRPVAVICGHGNSSRPVAALLRSRGFDAASVAGGMAAWETVVIARRLTPPASLDHLIQLDRVGKGCLSYILASDDRAVLIDPGRHLHRHEAVLADLGATLVAVIDTHMHADYLSGATWAARRWDVPYLVHPEDAVSPYDGTPGQIAFEPLAAGGDVAFGRARLHVNHVPGHTLGSVTLRTDDAVLTGDLLFVASVGRPDLGDRAEAWSRLLWRSLEHIRQTWAGDELVLPAHYGAESERRPDRVVAGRFDEIRSTNEALRIRDQPTFLRWLTAQGLATPPPEYRTIKLANLGLAHPTDVEAQALEFGRSQCAVG
jgi:glyoxylase-like metal-dependent hydrolase (beta-lactamase superfamily II)